MSEAVEQYTGPETSDEALALIRKSTRTQQDALSAIACGMDGGHPMSTLQALVRKGLIERYNQRDGIYTTYRYAVPVHVHIAWCAWATEQPEDEDDE